ncbi:caspase family protein [Priestia megaterium]|uniref:caspase family protein n=1 Tax=Priestia megaterium TaxID=1404 RepID=UPI00296EFF40|nr:caspase family protein [Priestia megaterium]MDW4511793.1 caspase family protein [Priestia megaterium]
MGVKLAILIGVSKYENCTNLDACLRDVEVIYELIKQTHSYQDILYINHDTNSDSVKPKVIEFIKKHAESNTEVEQVFFYFTGHGEATSSDVHYLLSDYDSSKKKSTSLENTEIDSYLRLLGPKLAVKVIDACYSGVAYIKDGDEQIVERNFRSSAAGQGINNCYFMFSSQNNETSHAQGLSYFTESFIEAVLEQKDQTIVRFKDITDRISDIFSTIYKGEQTPQFVNQANLTEEFCLVTSELKEKVKETLSVSGALAIKQPETRTEIPLFDFIVKESQDYCTDFNEVVAVFNEVIKPIVDNYKLVGILENLYELKIIISSMSEMYPVIGKVESVASVLDKKKNSYFVDIIYDEEKKDVRNGIWSVGTLFSRDRSPVDFAVRSSNVPFDNINIEFKAKYPVLESYNCSILIFLSRLNLLIMDSCAPYKETAWDVYEVDEDKITWSFKEIKIKDSEKLESYIELILEKSSKIIMNNVNELYKSASERINGSFVSGDGGGTKRRERKVEGLIVQNPVKTKNLPAPMVNE